MINVRGQPLDIDVRAELEDFPWINANWSNPTRLIASSPFYYDRNPAFYVILDEDNAAYGCWGDSGADDPEYQRGGFVKLLSFLRDETYEETCDYLAHVYSIITDDNAEFTLKLPKLNVVDKPRITTIDNAILDRYNFRSPYLGGRGISEGVQQLLRVGYDRKRRAVTIPWFNPDGTLGNIKYRKTEGKAFWYEKGARPIREMIYGINVIYTKRITRAAIVEAEVDAMTLMSAGIPAIATGGTAFNEAKRDLILRSPIEEITLFRDNDSAGAKWEDELKRELCRKIDVKTASVNPLFKDVNEWRDYEAIRRAYAESNICRNLAISIRCTS